MTANHNFILLDKKNKTLKTFIDIQKNTNLSKKEIEETKFQGINTNISVTHPITKKKIPVWIANYVINNYGFGAVMSVPGHNENDWNFAIKNNLKIQYVIDQSNIEHQKPLKKTFSLKKNSKKDLLKGGGFITILK